MTWEEEKNARTKKRQSADLGQHIRRTYWRALSSKSLSMVQAMKVIGVMTTWFFIWGCCRLPYYTVSTVRLPVLVWSFMRAWEAKRRRVKRTKNEQVIWGQAANSAWHSTYERRRVFRTLSTKIASRGDSMFVLQTWTWRPFLAESRREGKEEIWYSEGRNKNDKVKT